MKIDERKISEKEVYRLWWDYLERSDKYKVYCDSVRKVICDVRKKKGKEYLIKNMRHILSKESRKENKFIRQLFESGLPMEERGIIAAVIVKDMERNWLSFGDIYVGSFDDWWKEQEKINFSVPMIVLNDLNAHKKFPYFLEECELIKKERGKNPEPKEIIKILTEEENNYLFIAIPMVGKITMDDISKKIADVRAKWKKDDKFISSNFYFRRFYMPVSRVRFDELKRYLGIYDRKQMGLSIKQIIAEIDPYKRCNDVDVQRVFRSDLRKAKKIISNVESGFFPEIPPGL